MLIISKQQVENLIDRLGDPARFDESRGELEKMLEIQSSLLWRAEGPRSCCGSLEGVKVCIESEVQVLEEAIDALNKKDIPRASSLLKDYIKYMELLEQ
ncbi:MAG: hypothetical protein HQ588_06605 [Deltaproteobacteria bacterium]|nr:hypothetical protein [Deltaproteobacteria bacterium]